MLAAVQKILNHEMTIAEWIGTAVILSVPYLLIGAIWTITHISYLSHLHGVEWVVSFLATVAVWPIMLFPNICTA